MDKKNIIRASLPVNVLRVNALFRGHVGWSLIDITTLMYRRITKLPERMVIITCKLVYFNISP